MTNIIFRGEIKVFSELVMSLILLSLPNGAF